MLRILVDSIKMYWILSFILRYCLWLYWVFIMVIMPYLRRKSLFVENWSKGANSILIPLRPLNLLWKFPSFNIYIFLSFYNKWSGMSAKHKHKLQFKAAWIPLHHTELTSHQIRSSIRFRCVVWPYVKRNGIMCYCYKFMHKYLYLFTCGCDFFYLLPKSLFAIDG